MSAFVKAFAHAGASLIIVLLIDYLIGERITVAQYATALAISALHRSYSESRP